MKTYLTILVAILCLFSSCKSSYKVTSAYGVESIFHFSDSEKFAAELLMIKSDSIWFDLNSKIYLGKLADIKMIHTKELESSSRPALLYVSGAASLIAGGAFFTDNDRESDYIGSGLIAVGLLSILSASRGMDKFRISNPFSIHDRERLRLYSRYPQGLSEKQLASLLEYYNQEEELDLKLRFQIPESNDGH